MMSLRGRIALLLIFAIVSVVALATFAASRVLLPPLPEATMEPLASQLHILRRLAETNRVAALDAGVTVAGSPATGVEESGMSRFLARALERTGEPTTAVITRSSDSPVLTASLELGNGEWVVTDIPDLRPPSGGHLALAGWIVLIVLGSTGIALFAASKITKPLELLENATSNVGPDGLLAHIPETGAGEIRATAKALNDLSVRLKFAMESRMRLVAAAGHDLRTPMTRMRLRAEFVEDEEERTKWLADLEELDVIADSAIELVREEIGGETLSPVELGHLIHEVAEELHEVGLKVEMPPAVSLTVAAKPLALKRALRNLVTNAATHGGGATMEIRQQGNNAILVILDQGPGIPEELIHQVFEPFFRVDMARRRTLPGAGLGLAIAREIIERFDGTITIANRQPNGLAQTVMLPLVESTHGVFSLT
ncbi:ATP-binding protein [Neoaquamicrobium sediminum]|uniref:ATP-binding protein n=1 Tax=Neoaquamicrobium sediminum TaxID=1849104 RepID=UPI004035E5CA